MLDAPELNHVQRNSQDDNANATTSTTYWYVDGVVALRRYVALHARGDIAAMINALWFALDVTTIA